MRFGSVLLVLAILLVLLFGCGGEAGPPARTPRTLALDEISLSSCPDRDPGVSLVEAHPVAEPVRPAAVGVWSRWCDPTSPGPHVPRGPDELIYDGEFVTLVSNVQPIVRPDPPLRAYVYQDVYRLESRWAGDLLQVRFPPWLLHDAGEERWVEIARFSDDRFLWPDTNELAYERGQPRRDSRASRALAEPREPLDYERVATDRARSALVYRSIDVALHHCAVISIEGLRRPSDRLHIDLSVRLDPTGRIVDEPTVETEDEDLTTCIAEALVDLRAEGYQFPENATYELGFLVAAR